MTALSSAKSRIHGTQMIQGERYCMKKVKLTAITAAIRLLVPVSRGPRRWDVGGVLAMADDATTCGKMQ